MSLVDDQATGQRPKRRRRVDWSFPIARIAGIQIRVHATFFILVLLFALSESAPGGLGLLGGLAWLAAIFACVLIHEFAHSLVARSRGAVVHSIVLLPIGGVSRMEKLPTLWYDELAIAIVGPLASFGLAGLAAVASFVTGASLLPVNIYDGAFVPRLVWLNLLLGAFNLLPAFPLDGGRVLRSLLERRWDLETATHKAATIGRALGAAMVVVGIFWNLWLIIIGAFVYLGASEEEKATIVHARLRGLKVASLMRGGVMVLDGRQALSSLPLQPYGQLWQPEFPVALDGHYAGLLSPGAWSVGREGLTLLDVTDREAPALEAGDDLDEKGLGQLVESGRRALAVTQYGQVVGLLCLDDVASYVAQVTTRRQQRTG